MTIFFRQVEFARPLWLVGLAALPLMIVLWRRSLLCLSPGRRFFSVLLRVVLLSAVAIALASPIASVPGSVQLVFGKLSQILHSIEPPTVELTGPGHVRAGEPFALEVLVRSESSGTAIVDVKRDSKPVGQEKLHLVAGDNPMSIPAMVEKPSRVVYCVNVSGTGYPLAGGVPTNDGGTRSMPDTLAACPIYVGPPPRVLLVEGQAGLAEHLKKALIAEHIEVEAGLQLPLGRQALNHYDLIILANVPADAFSKVESDALVKYVRDGGGLLAIGGDRSFTVGGYRHSPLEEILPVLSIPREKPMPSLAMVLVLDISGSMNDPVSPGAKERNIDLAKEALRRAVGILGPRDQLGVLVFEDTSRWIWPLSPVTDKQKIIDKIDTIQAEGETNMYPPLEKAYLALRESFADVKHIIVATDGISAPGDFEGLARKMAADGITMSAVGVGSEPVRPFLQRLADLAKGRAYFCDNGKAIPQIFQTETGVAAKIGITEEPFFPQMVRAEKGTVPFLPPRDPQASILGTPQKSGQSPAPSLGEFGLAGAPALLGYVETKPRPDANVLLATKSGEPLLATRRYGRGTAAAFTSDIQNRWAAQWLTWPGFGHFWVQLARETMRREPQQSSRLTAEAADDRLYITLDAEDETGEWINSADVQVAVDCRPPLHGQRNASVHGEGRGEGGPNPPLAESQREGGSGETTTLTLSQIAPGRYTAWLPAELGTYWLTARIRRDGELLDTVRGAAAVVTMPETVPKADGGIAVAERPGMKTVLIWPWLLAFAAVVFVLDLAVRRTA